MAKEKIIKSLVLFAQVSNNCAHNEYSYYQKSFQYKRKFKAVKKALRMLQSMKHSSISYKCDYIYDQNGYPSVITYFEWAEKTETIQFSFHCPRRHHDRKINTYHGGKKEISWDGVIGQSQENYVRYKSKYLTEEDKDEVLRLLNIKKK